MLKALAIKLFSMIGIYLSLIVVLLGSFPKTILYDCQLEQRNQRQKMKRKEKVYTNIPPHPAHYHAVNNTNESFVAHK